MATIETIPVSRPTAEDADRLMQLATGFFFTAALQPIARMNIPDLLADGPLPISELAHKTGSNEDALYRVMRSLSTAGAFAEMPGRVFALTPVSELMRTGVPGSLRDFVIWISNNFHFKVWSEMAHSIRTGQPAVEHATGRVCFDAIFGVPDVAYDFNMAMTNFSRLIAPAVIGAYDFSGIGTLMDVAGGHGAILCEILTAYPQMKGILFDLPNVIQEANCHICSLKMEDRCQTVHGDFFEDIPAGADAYYMQHIIHDWNDERSLKILGNVRKALKDRKDGRLIIVDCIVGEASGPDMSKWLDLEMLLMPGGRERTRKEWDTLMAQAGFEITKAVPIALGKAVIEARLKG
jgi:hypothetical protein